MGVANTIEAAKGEESVVLEPGDVHFGRRGKFSSKEDRSRRMNGDESIGRIRSFTEGGSQLNANGIHSRFRAIGKYARSVQMLTLILVQRPIEISKSF